MNPSTPGWIRKHLYNFASMRDIIKGNTYYSDLRSTGFIYGTSVDTLIPKSSEQLKWTEIEKTKINLFDALLLSYYINYPKTSESEGVSKILDFYTKLNQQQHLLFQKVLSPTDQLALLEKIISKRVQTNESVLKKNFSHIIANSLLYIDVLAFEHFLTTNSDPYLYAVKFEEALLRMVFLALNTKSVQDPYDELLIKLFTYSVRYTNIPETAIAQHEEISLAHYTKVNERSYLLDIASLAVWNDDKLDVEEQHFMHDLGQEFELDSNEIVDALFNVRHFIQNHKEKISFFNYSYPLKHFYQQTSRSVKVLILRNKKRLLQELLQSKELVQLLHQSTKRNLSLSEKQIVKEQLLDICKTVPSLAIFILPGGSFLMPLFIKLIPQLLPSAFNENRM